jgi:MinD-like ATPase involved in chromosome partitioning or flagellar assembly
VTRIICFHSFREAAGKSTVAGNAAVVLARRGYRVLLVNGRPGNLSLPGLFGGVSVSRPVQEYIAGRCPPAHAITAITEGIGEIGRLWYAYLSAEDFSLQGLADALLDFGEAFNLDFVLIEDPAGLERRALALFALAELLIVILALHPEDYQGTAVLIDVARRIDVPEIAVVVNFVPDEYDREVLRREIATNYGCEVAAILPREEAILPLGLIAARLPGHPVSNAINVLVDVIVRP